MPMPTYDETRWPVVVVHLAPGPMTKSEFEVHLERLAGYLQRRAPYAVVINVGTSDLDGDLRQRLAEFHKKYDAEIRMYRRAMGIVVRSSLQRLMIGAVNTLFLRAYTFRAFEDVEDAVEWATRMVARAGPPTT